MASLAGIKWTRHARPYHTIPDFHCCNAFHDYNDHWVVKAHRLAVAAASAKVESI